MVYETVMAKLGYKKSGARWIPKMLTNENKKKRMGSELTRYAEEGY